MGKGLWADWPTVPCGWACLSWALCGALARRPFLGAGHMASMHACMHAPRPRQTHSPGVCPAPTPLCRPPPSPGLACSQHPGMQQPRFALPHAHSGKDIANDVIVPRAATDGVQRHGRAGGVGIEGLLRAGALVAVPVLRVGAVALHVAANAADAPQTECRWGGRRHPLGEGGRQRGEAIEANCGSVPANPVLQAAPLHRPPLKRQPVSHVRGEAQRVACWHKEGRQGAGASNRCRRIRPLLSMLDWQRW